jgi:hypothetical protein
VLEVCPATAELTAGRKVTEVVQVREGDPAEMGDRVHLMQRFKEATSQHRVRPADRRVSGPSPG